MLATCARLRYQARQKDQKGQKGLPMPDFTKSAMNADDLNALLEGAGVNAAWLADALAMNTRTVQRMRSGQADIGPAAALRIRLLLDPQATAHALPPAWEGSLNTLLDQLTHQHGPAPEPVQIMARKALATALALLAPAWPSPAAPPPIGE